MRLRLRLRLRIRLRLRKLWSAESVVFQLKTSGFGARSCKGYLGDQYVSCVGGQGDVCKVIIQESHPDMDRFAL